MHAEAEERVYKRENTHCKMQLSLKTWQNGINKT